MNNLWTWFLLGVFLMGLSQQPVPNSAQHPGIMLVAVSHDAKMGGTRLSVEVTKRPLVVEPVALLTPSGDWQSLPCRGDGLGNQQVAACEKFAREYLSSPTLTLKR
jgi:hypothetical protein